jgi:hypothetical protein
VEQRTWRRADRLFRRALELRPEAVQAMLDRECDGDDDLRRLVERLLGLAARDAPLPGGRPQFADLLREATRKDDH